MNRIPSGVNEVNSINFLVHFLPDICEKLFFSFQLQIKPFAICRSEASIHIMGTSSVYMYLHRFLAVFLRFKNVLFCFFKLF